MTRSRVHLGGGLWSLAAAWERMPAMWELEQILGGSVGGMARLGVEVQASVGWDLHFPEGGLPLYC